MEHDPIVSVVVPVLNGARTLPALLDALAAQVLEGPWEIVVGDGGSTDGTRDILAAAAQRLPLRVIDDPGRSASRSRERPLRAARAETIAFTDADCRPDPGWLAAGLRALSRAELAQGRVIPDGDVGPFDRTVTVLTEYGLYETANLFVRRRLAERAGGFEPVPGLAVPGEAAFGEDVWFAWRCKRAGARSVFAGDAVVRHEVRPRGALEFVGERRLRRLFPPLVAAVPELRDTFLHRRWFLSPASLRFDAALTGLALASMTRRSPGRTLGLALSLPYLLDIRRERRRYPGSLGRHVAVARVAADLVSCAALLDGSLRARCPVL